MAVTEEGMKFLLEADVNQFERGMSNAQTAANNAAKGIVAAGVRIQGASNYIDALQKDLKGLVAGLKTGETQFVATGMAVNSAGRAVQTFGSDVARSAPNIRAISGVTNSFNQLLRETPNFAIDARIGILSLSNNIPIFVDSVNNAIRSGNGFIGVLKGLGASLFSIGGVIQLGVTLLTIFANDLFGTEKAAKDAGDQIKSLSDIQKDYNQTLKTSNANALKEVSVLNQLFSIAQDETRSRKDRTAALRELKSATDGYLDSLSLETINTEKARKALDQFNQSLFVSALIKSNEKQVQDLADAYGKLAQQGEDGKKRIDELNKAIAEANRPGGDIEGESRFDRVVRLSRERANLILETNNAIKQQNAIYDQIFATGTKIANLQVQLNPFKSPAGEGGGNAAKEIDEVSKIISKLESDINGLNLVFKSTGGNVADLANDKIKRLQRALQDLGELGIKPTDNLFLQIDARIKQLESGLARTPVNLKIPVNIEPIPPSQSNVAAAFKPLVDSLDFEQLTDFQKRFNDNFNNALRSGVANIASGIGEAIGGLITGAKSLGDVFNGIIGLFGRFIKQLGESMIAAGTATIAAKALIKNPYAAVAAGIIAVAAGSLIESSLSKAPSFATGGTVYGSQMIQAGDNTTQKEHILSDLQLKKIAQGAGIGGGNAIIAETRVSGTDLVILLKQAEGSIASING
jgi:hypothetical protein